MTIKTTIIKFAEMMIEKEEEAQSIKIIVETKNKKIKYKKFRENK